MASTEARHPKLAATEAGAGVSTEAAVIWPDPSPLDAWWRRIMHSDPVRRGAA
ncbi:hypothetical protein ABTW96_18645 [Nocardia beijingensis]|uniref:hypothetical protein n=1 Tax=Nocardia beijingensis TaxID=95162 RepID=UPI003327213C